MDHLTFGQARKLLLVNGKPISAKTVEKFIKKNLLTVQETIWGGWRLFDKAQVVNLASHLPKKLKKGLPITFH